MPVATKFLFARIWRAPYAIARQNTLREEVGGATRLFISDLNGPLYIVDKETKTFTVVVGAKQEFSKEQFRAFGRFVRERFDDFAWENDRVAHRTYGKALETWAGEPLTSSTMDIWSKRTPRMVVNDWYLADHYHADSGEGFDDYSAGKSRG